MTSLKNTLTPPLFDLSRVDDWKKHLSEEGYVVIKDILSIEEKNVSLELFKQDWATVTPNFSWENKDTWGIEHSPMIFNKGMAVFNGFGQSDFMWSLRTNTRIQEIYQKLYDTQELVVSFDGFSVYLSPKQKSKSWLHIDQNPKNPDLSIQGAYNFFQVDNDDSGFCVVPKSHINYQPEIKHNKNWIVCNEDYLIENNVKLLIPENCFTLWNSRLVHANLGMAKKNKEFNRLTCYITYLPKTTRTMAVLEKRKLAYLDSQTTSHWANKCELKRYPFGFKTRYENRGYSNITRSLENDEIPKDRLILI